VIEYVPIVESPCISVCVMDAGTGWCIGCGRTLDEIGRWGETGQADRDTVMEKLPARMKQLEGKA
jgi:predicted Fe-S protein YdhL (DUF1289 family)